MTTLKNFLKRISCLNIKRYHPTFFRVIALTLSIVLSISTITLVNYFQVSYQNSFQTPLEKLIKEAIEAENLISSQVKVIKKRRGEQRNPKSTLLSINEITPHDINLDSVKVYQNKVTLVGTTTNSTAVISFSKDLEFSRGLFTDVEIDVRAISEKEIYFKITCQYNPPVGLPCVSNKSSENGDNYENTLQYAVKKVPVTEERKIEYLKKYLKQAAEEKEALDELLPKEINRNQVAQDLTKQANTLGLTVTNLYENKPWQDKENFCKVYWSYISVIGNYNDVIKFLEGFGTSRLITNVDSITVNKFLTKSLEQSVEATISFTVFSANNEDLRPLFSTKKSDFETRMIKDLETEIVYLEDQDVEEETEETFEEAEEAEEVEELTAEEAFEEAAWRATEHIKYFLISNEVEAKTSCSSPQFYVEAKTSPFGN